MEAWTCERECDGDPALAVGDHARAAVVAAGFMNWTLSGGVGGWGSTDEDEWRDSDDPHGEPRTTMGMFRAYEAWCLGNGVELGGW